MRLKFLDISSDKILSISAITIAVVSIFVSVWEGIETRKHNRLSVRPKLEIFYNKSKDKFGYVLVNNGLGPAVITEKKIVVDNEEIAYSGFSGYEDFLSKLNLGDRFIGQGAINPGIAIRAGENENIVSFKLFEPDKLEELLSQVYNRVLIEIEYKSMYGELYTCRIPRTE